MYPNLYHLLYLLDVASQCGAMQHIKKNFKKIIKIQKDEDKNEWAGLDEDDGAVEETVSAWFKEDVLEWDWRNVKSWWHCSWEKGKCGTETEYEIDWPAMAWLAVGFLGFALYLGG